MRHVYQTLPIASRRDLAGALSAATPRPPPAEGARQEATVSVMRTARRRAKLPVVDKPQTLHVTIELKRSSDPPPGRLTSMTLPTRSRAG